MLLVVNQNLSEYIDIPQIFDEVITPGWRTLTFNIAVNSVYCRYSFFLATFPVLPIAHLI